MTVNNEAIKGLLHSCMSLTDMFGFEQDPVKADILNKTIILYGIFSDTILAKLEDLESDEEDVQVTREQSYENMKEYLEQYKPTETSEENDLTLYNLVIQAFTQWKLQFNMDELYNEVVQEWEETKLVVEQSEDTEENGE